MRQIRNYILFLVFCLAFPVVSHAAPIYGSKMPKQKQVFLGLQSYSVFNRNLDKDYGKLRSQQEFLLISYGVYDWLSLDLKGGFGDIKQRGTAQDIDYSTALAGGYGFRLRLYEQEQTKVIFGFQHISVHPHSLWVGALRNKAVLDDWQFSALVSHDFKHFTPYIGTRWSWMNEIHWVDHTRKMEKSDLGEGVGLIIGMDLPLSKKVWFNVEGQFFDATAVAGSINFAF